MIYYFGCGGDIKLICLSTGTWVGEHIKYGLVSNSNISAFGLLQSYRAAGPQFCGRDIFINIYTVIFFELHAT